MTHQILIVDDDARNIDLLEAILISDKLSITTCDNGKDALKLALACRPDLILLDVMMPGIDGIEVTSRLKGDPATEYIPIILITAFDNREQKLKGLEAGADDFLTKPVDQSELKARVNSLLKLKNYHDRLLDYQKNLEQKVARRTRKLEHALVKREEAERQLVQAQKMEAMGTLAGGIAHDFNNILSSIIGFTELAMESVMESTNNPKQTCPELEEVLIASERARKLILQILTFSRQSDVEFKPLRVSSLISESETLLRSSLPAMIEIRSNINSQAMVMGDPTQINQILMNLGTNALHAMEQDGGVLEITLDEVNLTHTLADQREGIIPGRYLELTVSDTGCGIPPDIRERIFDPFFTTKPHGKGTGIGLSTVHGIVKSHNGKIEVDSSVGQGTLFTIHLPVVQQEKSEERGPQQALPKGNETILLVDDERALADMGRKRLQSLGYQVEVRTSSIEALECFRAAPGGFDLVITDLNMPNMNGTELVAEIKSIRWQIPIILCTGFSDTLTMDQARSSGIDGMLNKPVLKKELSQMVRTLLDKKPENPEEVQGVTILKS